MAARLSAHTQNQVPKSIGIHVVLWPPSILYLVARIEPANAWDANRNQSIQNSPRSARGHWSCVFVCRLAIGNIANQLVDLCVREVANPESVCECALQLKAWSQVAFKTRKRIRCTQATCATSELTLEIYRPASECETSERVVPAR